MKTLNKIAMVMAVAALFMLPACKKEAGIGGKAEIHGSVTYTGGTAEGAVVSITYDATEAGEASNTTTVGSDGHYEFMGLEKGDYYIDATYMDAMGFNFTCPGTVVTIGGKKSEVTVDLSLN